MLDTQLSFLLTAELLDQLARAPVVVSRERPLLLELPARNDSIATEDTGQAIVVDGGGVLV